MNLNSRILKYRHILSKGDMVRLKKAADHAQTLESYWMRKLQDHYQHVNQNVLESLEKYGRLPKEIDFFDFYMEMAFTVMYEGMKTAASKEFTEIDPSQALGVQLAKPPKGKVPSNFKDLMKAWDLYRKGKIPKKGKWAQYFKRQKDNAEGVKKAYLDKVHQAWKKHSKEFREGSIFSQQQARKQIQKAASTTYSRASTIVQTETTHYYNKARREIYDKSPDVTHYLFVPVRDAATTKWCKTRDGLVYEKGSKYLDKETPPIHWNCRSELLPLTPANPNHLRLIQDKSRARPNRRPAPLHPKWVA